MSGRLGMVPIDIAISIDVGEMFKCSDINMNDI